MNAIIRYISNWIYLVPISVKRFNRRYPDSPVIAAGATKARKVESDGDVRYEPGWITAKRGSLILAEDKLVCGSWKIPLVSISSATLLRVRSIAAKGLVLKVSTHAGEHYQFGLVYDPSWEKQMALSLSIEDSKLKYSLFSILVRVLLFIVIIRFVLRWLGYSL